MCFCDPQFAQCAIIVRPIRDPRGDHDDPVPHDPIISIIADHRYIDSVARPANMRDVSKKLWMKVVALRKPLMLVALLVLGVIVFYELSK